MKEIQHKGVENIYICVYAYVKIKTKLNIQFRSGCLFPAQCDTPKYPILGYLK